MVELLRVLQGLDAHPDDVIFYDSMSLYQWCVAGDSLGPTITEGRTKAQQEAFDFALNDMQRLYTFYRCEVIILPYLDHEFLEDPQNFPEDCAPDLKHAHSPIWGKKNARAYEERGWCVTEFSIARFTGTLVGTADALQIMGTRSFWPASTEEYKNFIEDGMIQFTNSTDIRFALMIFFRACFNLLGESSAVMI